MKRKRPRDTNQLAKFIVDLSVGEATEPDPLAGKDRQKVESGSMGGKKGGRARAARLSPERRKAIAAKAAKARWEK